jgi:hypothetical protein
MAAFSPAPAIVGQVQHRLYIPTLLSWGLNQMVGLLQPGQLNLPIGWGDNPIGHYRINRMIRLVNRNKQLSPLGWHL